MQLVDPTGVLTFLGTLPWLGPYLPWVVGFFVVCKLFTMFVPPPVAGSRFVTAYKVVSIIAGNIGFARNATPPGMQAEVRDASITAAKQVAAAPELATVAAIKAVPEAVIAPGVKAS